MSKISLNIEIYHDTNYQPILILEEIQQVTSKPVLNIYVPQSH